MNLLLDGQPCDLPAEAIVLPGFDADELSDVESGRKGHSLKVILPQTPTNDRLFCFACDPHAAQLFNATLHKAQLGEGDTELFAGVLRLLSASGEGYRIEIRGGAAQWAKNAARRMFNRIPLSGSYQLTPTAIAASWTNDSPVKFLPIHRDEYTRRNSSSDLLPAERLLSVDDYHPFLHIATLVRAIAEEAGYAVNSRFMETEFFKKLYMSGAYSQRNTEALRSRMEFFARRQTDATAAADVVGRVYANPYGTANMVGDIVQTATPQSLDEEGVVIPDLFNNGGCFGSDDGRIVFRPTTELSVGFEYYIRYTTDHRILSREQLRGFDSVNLGTGSNLRFTLANRYQDQRNALRASYSYRVIVFNHTSGAQYRLLYTRNGVAGSLWTEFATRMAAASTSAGTYTAPVLQIRSGSFWTAYTGDWALYNGYIGETGQTTLELRVRTAPEKITPTAPKYFNTIYFHGADEGMRMTLHKETSLRPAFSSHPGYGATVSFEQIAQQPVRQAEFLDALQHLFNLRFYTCEATKTLYIEPADDFYDRNRIADWSHKTDFAETVVTEDIALGMHDRQTWAYADADGAVNRLNTTLDTPFGEWSVQYNSFAAIEGDKQFENPLFCPTVNATGVYDNAPSALIMQVGDRDDISSSSDDNRFTPRIVRYCGIRPLPNGESWGYPSTRAEYPLAAFHHPGEGFSLCFEDRDGVTGLHRFYDRQVAQAQTRQHVTLSLQIEPHEFEALFQPGSENPHIGSVFRLDTGGETILATLRRIEKYDPEKPSTRCTFTRLSEDCP